MKDYVFHGANGEASLIDLFEGRRQLIVRHFMFGPDWDTGCPSCTAAADELCEGILRHLHARETTMAVVARAPYPTFAAYAAERGWSFRVYSSHGSDFNYDYHVTLDESVAPLEYNYRTRAEHEAAGTTGYVEGEQPIEQPGESFFLRDGAAVYHTYSAYARGAEATAGGSYFFLDHTALGRQEAWEEPKGRADDPHGAVPNFAT